MHRGRDDGSRLAAFEAATHRSMVVASLAVIPVYVGQAVVGDGSSWLTEPLRGARLLIHLIMAVDIGIRTYLAPRRLRFLLRHPVDLLAVTVPPVRALREVVALRTILMRPGLVRFTAFVTATITGCALIVYAAEHDHHGADIQSLGDAFWWAAVTATTVGYGDQVPVTSQGRAIALLLMLLGIALFSVLTAHIAAYFVSGEPSTDDARQMTDRLARIEATLVSIQEQLGPPADRAEQADASRRLAPEESRQSCRPSR